MPNNKFTWNHIVGMIISAMVVLIIINNLLLKKMAASWSKYFPIASIITMIFASLFLVTIKIISDRRFK